MYNIKFFLKIFLMLSLQTIHAQQLDFDFENWEKVVAYEGNDVDMNNEKASFKIKEMAYGMPQGWKPEYGHSVKRTTDAHSGKYALVVHHDYNISASGVCYRGRITNRPVSFSGYYKFLVGQVSDSVTKRFGFLEIAFTKYTRHKRDTLATLTYKLPPTAQYTSFNVPILWKNAQQPDSVYVSISSGNSYCPSYPYCHYLYVDGLKFQTRKKCKLWSNTNFSNDKNVFLTMRSQIQYQVKKIFHQVQLFFS
jgi:hypothetical protein